MSLLNNYFQSLFVLLLTVTTFNITNFAIAQTDSESLTPPNASPEKVRQTTITRKREKSSILESIMKLLTDREEPPLTSRSQICEITPGLLETPNVIYSDRPLFIWQGEITNLEINLYSPFSMDYDQKIIWTTSNNTPSHNIPYTGEALEPGKIYDWEIVTDSQTKRRRIAFEIMDGKKRDLISQELAQLETELTISGGTKEEIILAKAHYFAKQNLWSDTLQQLYFLEKMPDNMRSPSAEMLSYICQSE